MKLKNHLLLVLFIGMLSISCTNSDDLDVEVITDDVVTTDDGTIEEGEVADLEALVMTDVSYGDSEQEVYDIYLPAGRTPQKTKVLVLVHGGGWTAGDKEDMDEFILPLQIAHPDHAIVNMNYVLATLEGQTAFPDQFLNVQAVLNQLEANAQEHAILPEFGLIGVSAGAHIAMMYDYTFDDVDRVTFVANIVGPADFTDPFYADDPQFPFAVAALTDESAYPPDANYPEILSPALVVTTTASPTLQFYGDQDPIVPLTNGQRLDTALANANVEHIFTIYEGGHGDDWSEESRLDLQTKVSAYIDSFLAIEN